MDTPIKVHDKTFVYKKQALIFFKQMLNSYDFGDVVTPSDKKYLIDLYLENGTRMDKISIPIDFIRVDKVQYGTKCFCFYKVDGSIDTFSYTLCINGDRKPKRKFIEAARNSIDKDLRSVKQQYFDKNSSKGRVKCQETGVSSVWEELVVDHRQPNTFSIIVDRFIEVNNIDLNILQYEKDAENKIVFTQQELANNFRAYHKKLANLRLVRKEINSGRAYQGRSTRQKKDLSINTKS